MAPCVARAFFGLAVALVCCAGVNATAQQASDKSRALGARLQGASNGDLDELIERRAIRVGVPYSRTLYFNDRGRERGISADFVRDFERWINQKYARQLGGRPITVVVRPTTRDIMLKEVAEGLEDIALGNLTVTDERMRLVDFVPSSGQFLVSELVLTGPRSPTIATADDLSGKTVHVRKTSSYYESLKAMNERFKKTGRPETRLVFVPDALEDEDMMEMLNAGVFQVIVVDDWKARAWAQLLPRIKVNDAAVVRAGARIGWAIRKGSPKLTAALDEFYSSYVRKQGLVEQRMQTYYARIRQINDPTTTSGQRRFEDTLALFTKYGAEYRFDALMLAAQGYQESQLNQDARSKVGAIGIMQIMPATGADLKVGDIRLAEPNVHAGAKYMDRLIERYLSDAQFDETNRSLFAFACYNAGPANITRMRKEAEKRGLNPNQWFNSVELVTAEKIGLQTTTYVRNIYKYYVAYKLATEVQQAQQKAREAEQRQGGR